MLLGMRDAESSLALGRMAIPRGWPGLQECPWQGLLCPPSGHQRTAITSLPLSPFCRPRANEKFWKPEKPTKYSGNLQRLIRLGVEVEEEQTESEKDEEE